MSQNHSHTQHQSEKNLRTAFFLNLIFSIIEIIGGVYVNSVSILSDAVHDLGDSLSLGTAWFLERKSQKKPNSTYNFGYRRFSVLGALINGLILVVGSIFIIQEAIKRIQNPESVQAEGMFLLALLGVIINGWAAYKLQTGNSLNEKVVYLHLLEDVFGWIAIMIVSIILIFIDLPILDPLLSIAITLYILWGTIRRLRETIYILMQGSPKDVSEEILTKLILEIEGIQKVVYLRIWSLDGENHVINLKVQISDSKVNQETVKDSIRKVLQQKHIAFDTIEFSLS